MSEVPKDAWKLSAIMAGQGAYLCALGVYGAYASGWAAKAMHGAYAGAGSFAALGLCAAITPCLLYTSPSPRDGLLSRMPSSA